MPTRSRSSNNSKGNTRQRSNRSGSSRSDSRRSNGGHDGHHNDSRGQGRNKNRRSWRSGSSRNDQNGRSNNRNRRSRHSSKTDKDTQEVHGFLFVSRDGFGFLRQPENSLASSSADIFVPNHLISRYNLRPGVEITGEASSARKSKRNPLQRIHTVEGMPPQDYGHQPKFSSMTSVDPHRRLILERENRDMTLRLVDLITPMGFGQRALIVAPPRTGKTVILQKLVNAICGNHPEAKVIVMLVDERPEEVTDFTRNCQGAEVLSSSLDKDPSVHVEMSEMVLERCRRLVERGEDVVLCIDSLTRMSRAYNIERGKSGRTLSGGLDAQAMQKPREIFGAARVGELGSLTIIATALVDTGSRLDQVIFEEFKGTGNMELVLRRDMADHRIFPAIDVQESGTRKEEKLRTPDEHRRVNMLRRMLLRGKAMPAMEGLRKKMDETQNNAMFLMNLPKA